MTALFFVRCKPFSVDLQPVAIKHNCVFIGYALFRDDVTYVCENPQASIIPPNSEEAVTRHKEIPKKHKTQVIKNRNLIEKITKGSIVILPRPSEGYIYCGRITKNGFRISYCSDRYKDADEIFNNARASGTTGLKSCNNDLRLSGEIAQGWDVEEWIKLSIPVVPAYIRTSLFGRTTFGEIRQTTGMPDPFQEISKLMDSGGKQEKLDWTSDPENVLQRLKYFVTPNIFENLVVSLLQLEEPCNTWIAVGGSGDGGVDGLAYNQNGEPTTLLQCKLLWDGKKDIFSKMINRDEDKKLNKYLAYLCVPEQPTSLSDYRIIKPNEIATLLIKHANQIPFAKTLRVKQN